jgi:hypothetical protein
MNAPKLHHFVPQFYLRRFIGPDGSFWVCDKTTDRVFASTPGSVAAESDFYKLYDFEAAGYDPLLMEKQLSQLEGEVSLITDQWLTWLNEVSPGDKIEILVENRQLVSLYVALQFLRTADTRYTLCLFHERSTELSSKDRTRLHTDLLWDLELVRPFAEFLEKSIWIFGRNCSGVPFVTSDNPVAFKTGDNKMWLKAGFLAEGTYAVFPLSPEIVMYCKEQTLWHKVAQFNDCLSPVDFTAEMVEHENAGQVFMAGRFVISPINDFAGAREFASSIGTDRHAPPGWQKSG